jgi:ATP:corrinoid adenosyltransferase
MSGAGDEVTLVQFIQSKWFIGTARIMAIVGGTAVTLGGAFVTWAVLDTREQADKAASAVVEVRQAQKQQELRVNNVERKVDALDDKLDVVSASVSEVKGIVSELARRETAAQFYPGWSATTAPLR